MFVGPNHPIFGVGRGGTGLGPQRGPWGGDGYLPPMGAPPGHDLTRLGLRSLTEAVLGSREEVSGSKIQTMTSSCPLGW